ncbi:hypothetical protein PMAC_000862 [Pneumocystis sp. 'macacae']|nr:hypothetical protein PMAC_000862 [Pneumocystis sp. 'macacae']
MTQKRGVEDAEPLGTGGEEEGKRVRTEEDDEEDKGGRERMAEDRDQVYRGQEPAPHHVFQAQGGDYEEEDGLRRQAYELSVLTGTQVLLLVVSETGLVYTFTTPKLQPLVTKAEGKNLIQACLNAQDGGGTGGQEEAEGPMGGVMGGGLPGYGGGMRGLYFNPEQAAMYQQETWLTGAAAAIYAAGTDAGAAAAAPSAAPCADGGAPATPHGGHAYQGGQGHGGFGEGIYCILRRDYIEHEGRLRTRCFRKAGQAIWKARALGLSHKSSILMIFDSAVPWCRCGCGNLHTGVFEGGVCSGDAVCRVGWELGWDWRGRDVWECFCFLYLHGACIRPTGGLWLVAIAWMEIRIVA